MAQSVILFAVMPALVAGIHVFKAAERKTSNLRTDGAAVLRRRRRQIAFTARMPRGRSVHGLSLTMLAFRHILNRGARVRVEVTRGGGRVSARRATMKGVPPRKLLFSGRIAFPNLAVGVVAGALLVSACSQPSDTPQAPAQQQAAADEQTRKEADEKAWADAAQANTAAAMTAYVQNFSTGAHVAEARQRLAALEEQARKEADDKAWAEASRTGTAAAVNGYIQKFGAGAHVAEARQRLAVLAEQARKEADEKAWAEASRTGSAAAINGYLENFGSGAHVAEARQRLAALDEQARKEADEKAWAEASRTDSAPAISAYLQNFGSGAHVAEARQRATVLEAQARKEADEKAWAEAARTGTPAAMNAYLQNFPAGAHVAEARRRAAALGTQISREVPTVDIEKTCQAAAGVMVSLLGGSTTQQDVKGCLDSEQKAREQIIKDRASYSSADKTRCMRTGVYLPSYVEWLTCLEMERDVRKMQQEEPPAAASKTLPRVRPAINR
jgi:hypothetical protein